MANVTINSVPAVKTLSGTNKIPLSQNDNLAHTTTLDVLRKWVIDNSNINYSQILNKPDFAKVATTGNYKDLSNQPSIPTSTSQLKNDSGFVSEIKEIITNDKSFILDKIESNTVYMNEAVDMTDFILTNPNPTFQPTYIICKCAYTLPSTIKLPEKTILLNVPDVQHIFKEHSYTVMMCIKDFIIVFQGSESF